MRRRRTAWSIVLAPILAFAFSSAAHAGTYEVRNCLSSAKVHFDGVYEKYGSGRTHAALSCSTQKGGRVGLYQDRSWFPLVTGEGAAFRWTAPGGAKLIGTRILGVLRNANGIAAQIYASNSGGHGYIDVDSGAAHDGKKRQMNRSFASSPRTRFTVRLVCFRNPQCSNRPTDVKAFFQLEGIVLELEDERPPVVSAGGELFAGRSSYRGSASYSVSASDNGGGVRKLSAKVNGHQVPLRTVSCAGDRGGYADRTKPCPGSASKSGKLNTKKSPFREGSNTIRLCAADYANGPDGAATGPNVRCSSKKTITVDNGKPSAPEQLEVTGEGGWRAENDFHIRWTNPGGQITPITKAEYRLLDSAGTVRATGKSIKSPVSELRGIKVPGAGVFELRVRLIDSAGNSGAEQKVSLRFDDRRPGSPRPEEPPAWLGSADFPRVHRIDPAPPGGPSGIRGYAIRLFSDAGAQPCAAPACRTSEITHDGLEAGEPAEVTVPLLPEGEHWLSAAAVSGAGLASAQHGSAKFRVDRSDPETTISGVPRGWVKRPVELDVRAEDDLSGMEPDPETGLDDPVTAISVGGGSPSFRVGDTVSLTVRDEGRHEVRHWARDLAGNANSGARLSNGHSHRQAGTTVVRIDRTAPRARFLEPERERPERIRVSVKEPLSGLHEGRIEYRRSGSGDRFEPLETEATSKRLTARFPSDRLPHGEYELRASAVDRAGNASTSTVRAGGAPMLLSNPVKEQPAVRIEWAGTPGIRRVISHGRGEVVAGVAEDAKGRKIADATIEVIERFDRGSALEPRATAVRTDDRGRFRAWLAPGPTRTVLAGFPPTARYAQAGAGHLRLVSRGRARLNLAPQVARNGQPIRMRGDVRARGAQIPAGGKLVAIQYLDPAQRSWRPVEVLRTNRRGGFRFAYRFRTITIPQRIVFRAVALQEAGWPYRPAATRRRTVVVYPR